MFRVVRPHDENKRPSSTTMRINPAEKQQPEIFKFRLCWPGRPQTSRREHPKAYRNYTNIK